MQASEKVLRGAHCQCAACGLYFNSTYAFDCHRRGKHGESRRCLTVAEMEAAGMGLNEGGWWISRVMARPGLPCDSRSGDRPEEIAGGVEAGLGNGESVAT